MYLFDNAGGAATADGFGVLVNRADRHAALGKGDSNCSAAGECEVKCRSLGCNVGGLGIAEACDLNRPARASRRERAQRCHCVGRQGR